VTETIVEKIMPKKLSSLRKLTSTYIQESTNPRRINSPLTLTHNNHNAKSSVKEEISTAAKEKRMLHL
jgi:hypothetical protein